MMWILVYTKAKQENRANFNLQNQGFVTFLPLISSQKRTEKSKQLSPVFPRYIFVKIDPDLENWITIKSTLGVEKIVMFADKLTSVPNDIIKAIRSKLDDSDVFTEDIEVIEYAEGDNVFIDQGRFAGVEAIFLSRKSKDRVRLLLKLLNTTVLAEIDESSLRKKTSVEKLKNLVKKFFIMQMLKSYIIEGKV